jgi:TRAP-type C4-dicarboxylate transport system permease small subunit
MKISFDKYLSRGANIVLSILVGLMVLTVLLQVFYRYVLLSPLSWSEELARFTFVWITFLGGAMALGKHLHFGIDYFVNKFPPKLRELLEAMTTSLVLVFVIVLFFKGVAVAGAARTFKSAGLGMRMDLVYGVIPLSSLIMAYYAISEIIAAARKFLSRGD